ncbi:ribosomal protein L6P/L9E [Kibdelosporangium banguiense]|uniref:Ribosomal protein L6P/L9E n=1 Tax=Kibdelosporangium banguiense TaxID=1365924 RepID=A0ABS4T7Q8_9PSEU|nr:hypothetical protein [Kibdelosporangium banguiense]MBP2319901.1 ribosomal protein L6P/L9E [Kibdelosporangium banguiense]
MSRFPRWWFWAAVLVPALITVVGLTLQAGSIERQVQAEAHKVLPGAELVVSGRDVVVSGIPVEQITATESRLEAATGVRSVSVVDPELTSMSMVFRTGEVVVTGTTEQQSWREQFIRKLTQHTHGRALVDETKTQRGTDFPIKTKAAEALVALITQQPEDMTVTIEARKVTIAGVVPDDNRRKAIVALMKRLFGDTTVVDQTKTKE